MNEETLKYIYSHFEKSKKNVYGEDLPMDHFDITKNELKNLGIQFDEVYEKNKPRLYIKKNGKKLFRYTKSFYPNNSAYGIKVANDKLRSEKFLKYGDIQTTDSEIFKESEYKKAFNFVKDNPNTLVLKPLNLDGGLGVFIDIDKDNLKYAWDECIKAQKKRNVKDIKIIIQNKISGFEVRMIVAAGKFISATLRVPAHVKGDGINNIEQLINIKNKERESNSFLKRTPIKINERLEELLSYKAKDLNSILDKGEFCVLIPQSNMQHGGENFEITSFISESVKKQCEEIVSVFPGLHTAAIDLMINNFEDQKGTVIEVNKAPAFLINYYPAIGNPQNPFKYIFKSFMIEEDIKNNQMKYENLTKEDFEIILQRYKFNYQKQKEYEKIIKKMEIEIENLNE